MYFDVASFSWWDWHPHPSILLGVLALEGCYLYGAGSLRRRLGGDSAVSLSQAGAFTLGVVTIFVALASPIHELADNYLFSAHMVQHALLLWIMPPLLLVGLPGWLLRPLVASSRALKTARLIAHPIVTLAIFNAIIVVWHLPDSYNFALEHHNFHIVQHLSFMIAGVLMWWPVLSPMREVPRLSQPGQMLYLFLQSLLPAVVGGIITFGNDVLYDFYAQAPRLWDISAATDQQVGGLIMKTFGFIVFLVAMAAVFFSWAAKEEESEERSRKAPLVSYSIDDRDN